FGVEQQRRRIIPPERIQPTQLHPCGVGYARSRTGCNVVEAIAAAYRSLHRDTNLCGRHSGAQADPSCHLIGCALGEQAKRVQAGAVEAGSPSSGLQAARPAMCGNLVRVRQCDGASGNPLLQLAVFEIVLNDCAGLRNSRAASERRQEIEPQSAYQAERKSAGPDGITSAPGLM